MLAQIHGHLHSWAWIFKDKYVNIRHQVPNTHSRNLLDRISAKINMSAEKYQAVYASLLTLDSDPTAKWRSELQPLHRKDIWSMSDTDTLITSLPSDEDNVVPTCGLLPSGIIPEGS